MRTEEGGDATLEKWWWESSLQLGFRLRKGKAPRRRAHTDGRKGVSILRTAALAMVQDMTTETGSAVNYQGGLGRLPVWL